jgi:D-alanyl-lipoteichoic acid acyltransferase DltB (MBOAT superfamily)
MVIGGLWHGAAWNFVLWGFYHGSLLILHRVFLPILDRIFATNTRAGEFVSRLIRIVCMFALTCYGWLLFRAISLEQIWNMTVSLLRPLQGFDEQLALRVLLISLPLLVVQTIQYVSKRLEFLAFPWLPAAARVSCYAVFTYFVLFRGGKPQAFIYFQF